MRFFILPILLLMSMIMHSFGDDFSTDYCPYLSLISSSKDSIIYANVDSSKFYITIQSETNGSKCDIPFNESSVCGISMTKNENSTKQSFIYWGYDDDQDKYYLRSIYYTFNSAKNCLFNLTTKQYLASDPPIFKTLDNHLIAYGFDYNLFYFYDLQLNTVSSIISNKGNLTFTPSDMIITETNDQVIAVGYLKDIYQNSSLMFASVCLWNINRTNLSMLIVDCKRLHNDGYHFSEYHPGPKLSIDINKNQSNLIVIANSANRSIEIFLFNDTNLYKTHTYKSNVETNSVCWLSDGHRIATVAHLLATSPWSQSQIQIYDLNLTMYQWPQYVFPNSQQQLDLWSYKNPAFILLLNWQLWNSLIILMDTQKVLVILSTEAGSYPDPLLYSWFDNPWVWIGLKTRRLNESSSTPCWPGMYKYESSILSCDVCSPKTKSSSDATTCNLCNSSLFCPRGSVNDIDIRNLTDIEHITSYPTATDANKFEDILISNMFSIETKAHCLLISPLFWTLIVVLIASIILFIIGILKFFPNSHRHRALIKRIFRQADVIGEGELWIGGLMSFSVFVLIIFAFLFSNEFVNLYPIEDSKDPVMTCDKNLRNAQFSTSLKLLSSTRTDEEQIIFDMLDNQLFTLMISFVNTNFDCDLLNVLEGTGQNLHDPTDPLTCYQDNSNKIVYTSILAPHEVTFRYTINHFAPIGGIYICLIGPGNITDDGLNSIQNLEYCKWIAEDNQTIGSMPQITFLNTKVINRTDNLIQGQPTKSSGMWQPLFLGGELSDQKLYDREGEYHRYLNSQTVLTIILDENHYYLENIQVPVARKAEVNFHTILFVSLSLELFGLTFLVFKLLFVPLFRLIERQIFFRSTKIQIIQKEIDDNNSVESF